MGSSGADVDSSFVSTTLSSSFMASLRSGASGSTILASVTSTAVSSVNTVVLLVGLVMTSGLVSSSGQSVSVPHFLSY